MVNEYLTCGAFELGAVPVYAADCPKTEAPRLSQIAGLIVLPESAQPFTHTSATSITAAVQNTLTDNRAGRFIVGAGGMSSADHTVTLGRVHKVLAGRLYTVTFDTAITCATTFAFLRRLSANWTGFRFWAYTLGERLIGGASGITPSFVSVAFVTGAGRGEVERATVTIEFRADGEPDRDLVPGLFTLAGV
jgi:hypothetical protein